MQKDFFQRLHPIFLLAIAALLLPQCGGKKAAPAAGPKNYALFKQGSVPAPTKTVVTTLPKKEAAAAAVLERALAAKAAQRYITPELDFEVKNNTAKTVYVTCFSYIQKEEFARWRWDKSPIYKLEPEASVLVNVDTIPDDEHRDDIFGYLAVFDNEKEANDSIYELVEDRKKIDLDRIHKLENKTVVIDVERYGARKARLDFAVVSQLKKKLSPELDFIVQNQTGRTVFVTGFVYQIKDSVRSIWTYDKTPVLKLKQGVTGIIDIDAIADAEDRVNMFGFLGVFEEHQEKEARDATYELLPPKNKLSIGKLSRLKDKMVVVDIERYGAVGEISEFEIRPASGALAKFKKKTVGKGVVSKAIPKALLDSTTTPTFVPPTMKGNYQLFSQKNL